tara:strand:- start:3553 stop:4548 length:996 start_codon:yes stop_codon:yes gene_type:complete
MALLIERDQIGVREDLSSLIANVDARSTPLLSRIKSGDAPGNTKLEWQVDNYPSVGITGIVDESEAGAFENFGTRAVMHNYVQIFERKPQISRLADTVSDVAGLGKKEMANQIAKGLTMQKRDIEARFCSDHDAQVGTSSVGYETRGLGHFIDPTTTATVATTPVGYVPSGYTLNAAGQVDETTTLANVDDDIIRNILEGIWNNTGIPGTFVGLCGSAIKKKISDLTSFVNSAEVNINVTDSKVSQMVDIIDGDFGVVELHLSSFLEVDGSMAGNPNCLLVLDMDKLEARYARRPSFRALEDGGAGPRGLIESIVGLVCTNPLGFGKLVAA